MTSKDHEKIYDPLMEGTDVPADGDFSLEEILAEYGTSREQQILRDVERTVSAKTQEPTAKTAAGKQAAMPPEEEAPPEEAPADPLSEQESAPLSHPEFPERPVPSSRKRRESHPESIRAGPPPDPSPHPPWPNPRLSC